MTEFDFPVRVYYEDTDSGGVVYYANYLKFLERARTEWLRAIGFEQDRLREERNLLFAVSQVSLRYYKPALFNDLLQVSSAVSRVGRASITFAQHVRLAQREGRSSETLELCGGEVKVACVSATDFRPCPLPKDIIGQLGAS